jgi:hypothetical protein
MQILLIPTLHFKYVSVIGTANCNIGLNPNCNSLQEIKRVKIYGTDLHYAALCTNGNASYASIKPNRLGYLCIN